ncbi:hypothetical protein ABK040_016144 [Willaertia magna]
MALNLCRKNLLKHFSSKTTSSFLKTSRNSSIFSTTFHHFHTNLSNKLDLNIDAEFTKFEQLAEQGFSGEQPSAKQQVLSIIEKAKNEGKINYKNAWKFIRGYAILRDELQAESLYNEFLEAIPAEDKITLVKHHSALLNAYVLTQNLDKASKVFRSMPKVPKKEFEKLLEQEKLANQQATAGATGTTTTEKK